MGVQVETANGMPDGLKWFFAVALMAAAIGGFYYWPEQPLLLRVVGLLLAGGISVAVILRTEQGRTAWGVVKESRAEVRKVVWPTRKETLQTTLIVIVMVAVIAIMLWAVDGLLAFIMRQLLGREG